MSIEVEKTGNTFETFVYLHNSMAPNSNIINILSTINISRENYTHPNLKGSTKTNGLQGFFIEAGAADGEALSNTLYLEIKYGWTGLLVEPNPDFLRKLYNKHRNAY